MSTAWHNLLSARAHRDEHAYIERVAKAALLASSSLSHRVRDCSVQLQMDRFSDLETHLANLGALPNLAQASDYLSALTISDRFLQVAWALG